MRRDFQDEEAAAILRERLRRYYEEMRRLQELMSAGGTRQTMTIHVKLPARYRREMTAEEFQRAWGDDE